MIDVSALEMMCHAYQRWVEAEQEIARRNKSEKNSGDLAVTPNGHEQQSALRSIANAAQASYRMWAKEMGATPVARIRTAGTAQGDLFEFLGHGEDATPEDETNESDPSALDPTDPFGPPPSVLHS